MSNFQRSEAIDLLEAQTDVPLAEIERYNDFEMEAWLGELGCEWNPTGGYGMGAWEVQP